MKKKIVKIIPAILIFVLSMQAVAFAASTPPSYEQRAKKIYPPNRTVDISGQSGAKPKRPVVELETKNEATEEKEIVMGVGASQILYDVLYEYKDEKNEQTDVFETLPNSNQKETKTDDESEYLPEREYDDDSSVLEEVKKSITYITNNEAVIISEFLEECIAHGWQETPQTICYIASLYEEALLEEMSDIYNRLK